MAARGVQRTEVSDTISMVSLAGHHPAAVPLKQSTRGNIRFYGTGVIVSQRRESAPGSHRCNRRGCGRLSSVSTPESGNT